MCSSDLRGLAIAAKRSDRETSNGCVLVKKVNDFAAIIALKCETDFVANGADFIKLTSDILDAAIAAKAHTLDEVKTLKVGDADAQAAVTQRSGITGEKMELDGYCVLEGDNIEVYGAENTPGQNSNAVAELVFGLLVFTVRNFYNGKAGSELKGKKLGILAFGNVGRNVARIAKGFGMEVAAYDAFCPADVIEAAGVHAVKSQDELFQTCDIVSLHIPATPETIKSIDYKTVNQLPKGGILINTARKEVINEPELLKLLAEREDLKFITDIKPDADADFAKFEGRYFSTPKKMGAQTAEANINAGIAAAKQINAFFKDGCTKFQVNK